MPKSALLMPILTALFASASEVFAQLDESCTIGILNRTANVRPERIGRGNSSGRSRSDRARNDKFPGGLRPQDPRREMLGHR